MSSTKTLAAPPRRRRLRSWTSAATDDESTAAASSPAAAASAPSAAQSSGAVPKRKKARRQQLLAAAFGDQPRPPRWRDLSPAQRCFSDGLQLAFSFLSLFELIPAARTCRSWREAAEKASVPGVEVRNALSRPGSRDQRDSSRLRSLASSPFRRHVHALTHSDADFKQVTPHGQLQRPSWILSELRQVQHLPQLRCISGMSIELVSLRDELSTAQPTQPFTFPSLLESVDLHLSAEFVDEETDWSTDSVQRLVLAALRPCHSLTELSITMRPHSRLHLEPLLELTSLETLTLDIENACKASVDCCRFEQKHMSVVKQLSSLRRLTLRECEYAGDMNEDDPMGTRWMRWLCILPHKLQRLKELDLRQLCLQMEHMDLLQRLPALTEIEPACMLESAIPMLQAFAERLQRLNLIFILFNDEEEIDPDMVDFDTGFARGPWLVPHLAPCTALTQLTLSKCVFAEADATTLCQALIQLRELDLKDVGWPSFESLRHLPLLESFSLMRSKTYPLHFDAAHFKPLQRLRDLTLIGIGDQLPVDAAAGVIDALRPPSALLPALDHFCFSP